jgi:hypothetical protein
MPEGVRDRPARQVRIRRESAAAKGRKTRISAVLQNSRWHCAVRDFTVFASLQSKSMIEVEIYAAGVRQLEKILELDHEFEAVAGLRYKVDSNHDIVYLDFEEPTMTIQEIRAVFRKLGLEPRIVGGVPAELNPKSKTQPLRIGGMSV